MADFLQLPKYPTYNEVRHFLRLMPGHNQKLFMSMINNIRDQRGTVKEMQDWSNPDEWIPQRLIGAEAELALYLWQNSNKLLNPRHIYHIWRFVTRHKLIQVTDQTIARTKSGEGFISEFFGSVEQEIDYHEGVMRLLTIVAENGPGKKSDFIGQYAEWARQNTDSKADSVIAEAMYTRLVNLTERELIQRVGTINYQITERGLNYLETLEAPSQQEQVNALRDIRRLLASQEEEVHHCIADALSVMNPYAFEHLIKRLLESLGYTDVQVTSPGNDGGVDVIGEIAVGISSVREVVQVKRHKATIGRPILDQLRGSLHRFDAVRGTIISTGRFSSGAQEAAFERGAAPITLIDGDRLVQLLIDQQIGARQEVVKVLKFTPDDFNPPEDDISE